MKHKICCAVLIYVIAFIGSDVSALGTEDTTAPVLTDFTMMPKSIDTTNGTSIVTIELTMTDDLSGVCTQEDTSCYRPYITLSSPGGRSIRMHADEIASTGNESTLQAIFTIPQYSESGDWTITVTGLEDRVGNGIVDVFDSLKSSDLEAQFGSGVATLTNNATIDDTTPPVITSINIAPPTFDTTSSPATATVTFTVTDDLSGVCEDAVDEGCPYVRIRNGYSVEGEGYLDAKATKVGGTETNATYNASFPLSAQSYAGDWRIAHIQLMDKAGNEIDAFEADLSSQFGAGTITSTNLATDEDKTRPTVSAFSINPKIIDTAEGDVTVTVTATIEDDSAGINCINKDCNILIEPVGTSRYIPFSTLTKISGDKNQGVYEGEFTMPQYSQQGEWEVQISVQDFATNHMNFYESNLAPTFGAGIARFTNGDIISPTITSIKRHKPLIASTDATRATLRVNFSEAVKNVDLSDFVFSGSAASSIAQDGLHESITKVSDSTYDILIPKTQTGTLSIDVGGGNDITDLSGNPLETTAAPVKQEYTFTPKTAVQLHRFYSSIYRGHFYTTSEQEKEAIIANDANWSYEGVADSVLPSEQNDTGAVYRFWSEAFKHHFYTISEQEKQSIIDNDKNWSYEGESYYAYTVALENTKPMYRFYSPVYKGHFYTVNKEEKDLIIANDPNWTYEGVAWYVGDEW